MIICKCFWYLVPSEKKRWFQRERSVFNTVAIGGRYYINCIYFIILRYNYQTTFTNLTIFGCKMHVLVKDSDFFREIYNQNLPCGFE